MRMGTWQIMTTLLVVAVVGAVAALGVLNAGRTVTPPRGPVAGPPTAGPTATPTPAVTPRVLTTAPPTPRPTSTPEVSATASPAPVQPTATPPPQFVPARIGNTGGVGVVVRAEAGPQARALGNLREGTRVNLTGADATVAARQWREVEDPASGLRGWVLADYLLPPQ